MRRMAWSLGLAALLVPVVSVQALWPDPFARLDYGVNPDCPFDCDSVTIWIDGDLSSNAWTIPEVTGWVRDGYDITIDYYMRDSGGVLPVIVPFALEIPIGELPEGRYEVTHRFAVDNPLYTMPIIPIVPDVDTFRVAPPGDQTCDGYVNIMDIIHLIQHVFTGGPETDPWYRADVDCDGMVNIIDIVRLVLHTFAGQEICDPCDGLPPVTRVRITDDPPDSLRRDPYRFQDVTISSDILTVTLSHSGGCMDHDYAVFMSPATFMESAPVQANLYIQHIDPGDPCDAIITETRHFDLRPIADLYWLYYQSLDDIVLNVHDYDNEVFISLTYSPE